MYVDHTHLTSTVSNFYTGLKLGSKTHFYGRVVPEGVLAIRHMKMEPFTAAERPKRILVSKCTLTDRSHTFSRIWYENLKLYLYRSYEVSTSVLTLGSNVRMTRIARAR